MPTAAKPVRAAPSFFRHFLALPWRLGLGAAAGVLVAALAPGTLSPLVRVVAGWDGFALVTLTLMVLNMRLADVEDIRRVAASEDLTRSAASAVVVTGALASLVAVVGLLGTLKGLPQQAKVLHLGLGIGAVMLAWTLVHCVFTLRYAHAYYDTDDNGHDCRGLIFPQDAGPDAAPPPEPNYLDFAYFAFVVGMTAQTADVSISSRTIRGTALLHGLISFLFNTAIVALTIGTIGGLLG
jgi:uncharacterized membrane protein